MSNFTLTPIVLISGLGFADCGSMGTVSNRHIRAVTKVSYLGAPEQLLVTSVCHKIV